MPVVTCERCGQITGLGEEHCCSCFLLSKENEKLQEERPPTVTTPEPTYPVQVEQDQFFDLKVLCYLESRDIPDLIHDAIALYLAEHPVPEYRVTTTTEAVVVGRSGPNKAFPLVWDHRKVNVDGGGDT